MNIQYRVVLTGYDMIMHQPCVGAVLHQMHDTHIRAVQAAHEAAADEIRDMAYRKGMTLPSNVSVSFEDRADDSGITHATVIRYWDAKGFEHVLSEYDVYRVEELDNTHTNFMYRGWRIEYDVNDKWYWIYFLGNKRNHRWSGRSVAACCDIIDEECNNMLAQSM
jgi:hypothetical protein